VSLPVVLSQLEPVEAGMLDAMHDALEAAFTSYQQFARTVAPTFSAVRRESLNRQRLPVRLRRGPRC
jgi:hypothetical protein